MIERLCRFVGQCTPGKALKVTVEKYVKRRSDDQNKLLWGWVYPKVREVGGESLNGWTNEDLHELFLINWGGYEVIEFAGQKRKRPVRRSSKLSTVEFSDYIESILRFCAEQGFYIEMPDEVSA